MPYRYAADRRDASDLASGRVLHALPSTPALPVRLADEIFQRCLAARHAPAEEPLTLLDPCCGGGYHLTVLGLLHASRLERLIGVDIDPRAVETARRNLALLSVEGLEARAHALARDATTFGKESHREALASAQALRDRLAHALHGRRLETAAHVADATDNAALLACVGAAQVDVAIADVPYGLRSQWEGTDAPPEAPLTALLDALRPLLRPGAVVAIVADKGQKAAHPAYRRIEQFQVGKRRVALLAVVA